jgi:hypothetical protein
MEIRKIESFKEMIFEFNEYSGQEFKKATINENSFDSWENYEKDSHIWKSPEHVKVQKGTICKVLNFD